MLCLASYRGPDVILHAYSAQLMRPECYYLSVQATHPCMWVQMMARVVWERVDEKLEDNAKHLVTKPLEF